MFPRPPQNFGTYRTSRLPSPAIWRGVPDYFSPALQGMYAYWWDDFHNVGDLSGGSTAATDGLQQNYATYIDTSDTVRALATEKSRGVLRLATAATDNNAPVITHQGNRGTSFMLDDNTAADRMPLWFEARWRKSSITINQASIFVGLVEEARAINDGVLTDDTGALISTIDGIGFRVKHDANELDFTWQTASQTNQEAANIVGTGNSAAAALVAATWYSTGFRYKPDGGFHDRTATNRIGIYVNNIEYTTYLTSTQMAAATFPDGEELAFAASLKNGEATACTFDLDWIWILQQIMDP